MDTLKQDVIKADYKYCSNFGVILTDKQKDLPFMYLLPKMHKAPIVCHFMVASKRCSTKPLTKTISNISKMIYSHMECFPNKRQFYFIVLKYFVWFKILFLLLKN